MNIAAGLLGFFFLKLYTVVGTKLGFKIKPFTRQVSLQLTKCTVWLLTTRVCSAGSAVVGPPVM